MPQLAELQRRSPRASCPEGGGDEFLVLDVRAKLTPADMVEQKLLALLGCGPAAAGRPRPVRENRHLPNRGGE